MRGLTRTLLIGASIALAACGSSATEQAVEGQDSALISEAEVLATELKADGNLEEGTEARISTFSTHCGVHLLDRQVNGTSWESQTGTSSGDWIPEAWQKHVDEFERIDVIVVLTSPDELEITPVAGDETIVYVPSQADPQCD